MFTVVFMRKATNVVALNFLPRTSEPCKEKVFFLPFAENGIETYRPISSFYFKEN